MMSLVTGTGCQLSSLTAAFIAANQKRHTDGGGFCRLSHGACGRNGIWQALPS